MNLLFYFWLNMPVVGKLMLYYAHFQILKSTNENPEKIMPIHCTFVNFTRKITPRLQHKIEGKGRDVLPTYMGSGSGPFVLN